MTLPKEVCSAIAADDPEALARLTVDDAHLRAQDDAGYFALHLAAVGGRTRCLDLLLSHPGCDVNVYNQQGRTALHLSAFRGHLSAVERLLLADGIQVNQRSQGNGCTAAYFASCAGHARVVEALLRAGADANAATQSNSTPLIVAAFGGSLAAVEVLLAAGANPNVRNDAGSTAMHVAASSGFVTILEYLISHNGDRTLRDARGQTPGDIVASRAATRSFLPAKAPSRIVWEDNRDPQTKRPLHVSRCTETCSSHCEHLQSSAYADRSREGRVCPQHSDGHSAGHRDYTSFNSPWPFPQVAGWASEDNGNMETPTATSPTEQGGRSGRTASFRPRKHDDASPLDPGRDSSTHSGSRSAGGLSEKSHQTIVTEVFT